MVLDKGLPTALVAVGFALHIHNILRKGFVARGTREVLLKVLMAVPFNGFIASMKLDTSSVAARETRRASLCEDVKDEMFKRREKTITDLPLTHLLLSSSEEMAEIGVGVGSTGLSVDLSCVRWTLSDR